MDLELQELEEDYCRWRDKIGEDMYLGAKTLGILDVLRAHYLIVDFFATEYGEGVGGVGPKDLNLLHSTLSRQSSMYGNVSKWKDDFEICATLFWGLIKNHAFHDANKRTAMLSLFSHLIKLKRYPNAKQRVFEQLAIRIASNELNKYPNFNKFKNLLDCEVKFVADFLRKNTRRLDKEEYFVTYKQLDSMLRQHSFGLVSPNGNQIDIIKFHNETIGLFNRQTITTEKRVGSIGFPGWSRQVGKNVIKQIRRITNLTVEYGFDSQAFFYDADSLPSLISEYQGLLERLGRR